MPAAASRTRATAPGGERMRPGKMPLAAASQEHMTGSRGEDAGFELCVSRGEENVASCRCAANSNGINHDRTTTDDTTKGPTVAGGGRLKKVSPLAFF